MVMLNAFSTPIMLSAANVALPSVAEALEIDAVALSWVPMAYLTASAMFVLIFGRVADMFGRKRVFLLGTVSVILTSLIAASAQNEMWLISGRFLQGISAAMLYATQVAIISSIYPPEQRGQMIGLAVSGIYFGLMLGPIFGGSLIELFGWRASFVLHIPLCLIVIVIGLVAVSGEWRAEERGSFDIRGAGIYAASILALMLGVSWLPALSGVITLGLGLIGAWWFFHHEHRHPHPIFDVELFYTNRIFTMSCMASLLMYTGTYANVVLISLYLQYLKDFPPLATGFVMMAQPLIMALCSPFAGRLSDRVEPRVIASAGMSATAIGLFALSELDTNSSLIGILGCLLVTGLGFSLFTSPNANAIMGSVGKGQYGAAAGSVAVMRVVGQMASMGLVAMVFALVIGPVEITPAVHEQLSRAISLAFVCAAVACLPGIGFSLARGRLRET